MSLTFLNFLRYNTTVNLQVWTTVVNPVWNLLWNWKILFLAIDADVTNIEYYLKRTEILEELGDKNRAIAGFRRLLASNCYNTIYCKYNFVLVKRARKQSTLIYTFLNGLVWNKLVMVWSWRITVNKPFFQAYLLTEPAWVYFLFQNFASILSYGNSQLLLNFELYTCKSEKGRSEVILPRNEVQGKMIE